MMTNWTIEIGMKEFAKILKSLRIYRGLKQSQVSELLAISPRVYNRWERGVAVPRLDTLVKIADIFHASLDELTGREKPSDRQGLKLRNPKLHQLYHEIDKLSAEDQQALVILLDSLVKRSQIGHLLGR